MFLQSVLEHEHMDVYSLRGRVRVTRLPWTGVGEIHYHAQGCQCSKVSQHFSRHQPTFLLLDPQLELEAETLCLNLNVPGGPQVICVCIFII